ncbi:Clavaminate synthase-like protein [Lentithecium fluviatile CBS 122367]|uniref:Clavaminate synthase-like protein n=1 Tax=Lentithecium fluviatile CBS 122367 TaxID=1168545 RepID=A0A6G1IRA7_9PLEO|nr:Clavaminate synthase-like protein [Lentithecium fluviatile CBS 122367]
MASTLSDFDVISFPGQQRTSVFGYSEDHAFPLALKTKTDWEPNLEEAVTRITSLSKSGDLFKLVRQHGGAVLFRSLPISSPHDYSCLAHSFGFVPHEEVGRPPIRTVLAPNVKTANEGPPELPIWPHNEYGWSMHHPSWLTFSCLEIPRSGGATPLISSIGLAYRLEKEAPDFLKRLLQRGVRYVYRYGREEVVSTTGASVFAAYGQRIEDSDDEETIKHKIEEEVKRHSELFEWHEDGSLSVTHIVPIIRKHLETGSTSWFGNLTSAYGRSRHHGATQPPFRGDDGSYHPLPTYGDGLPISTDDLELALNIAEEMQVDVHWEQGDIVLLDNLAVMHSRKPWVGKRLVLAALWDDVGEPRMDDFEEGRRLLEARSQYAKSTAPEKSLNAGTSDISSLSDAATSQPPLGF